MNPRKRAVLRMFRLTTTWPEPDPVRAADRRTSMDDARTALSIARGVDLDDIHLGTGHDLSYRAYERVRKSWVDLIAADGWTDWIRATCAAAGDNWRRHRPEYLDKLPWPAPEPELTDEDLALCADEAAWKRKEDH